MIIVEKVLGNIKRDALWQARAAANPADMLELTQWEAQKSRCRKRTRAGLELGIALPRQQLLQDGDVVLWDEQQARAVVVKIQLRAVMVIHLESLLAQERHSLMRISFELGHALGNQHWKAVLKDTRIYIPLTVATHVMEAVMKTHGFHYLPYSFVPGESVLPALTQAEARLLFGGAEDAATHVHVAHAADQQVTQEK
ncbi:urease accessory protein UreE [Mixta tenebrionis]|mgnify:CR=1 FL=1|uniref:Urease accessory protein UreE n=1 Tax=Mixta tenebrionis TaxID=2562439 RepID=A0A506V6V4_9GAMM|nr:MULTISPECIES: urease accessory protein UreE [Mixta]QHM76448.1 Urease accessory protein UreE [Mixta theicola]TPW41407.1 urease accessory protein UreE [Mixta tenebrionis]